jgi:hypothetical protein
VYYFDRAEQHLVPDARYTAMSDPKLLANWLVTQLAQQPREQLRNAVRTELPAQTTPKVTLGSPVSIEIPGSSRLDASTRDRLAAQLALTLSQVRTSGEFEMTDSDEPVNVPAVDGTTFTSSDFTDVVADGVASAKLYYIEHGAVMNAKGHPIRGPLGTQRYGLHTIALTKPAGSGHLLAAGTSGSNGKRHLLVGTARGGLHAAGLTGALSRPAWARHGDEVWVGDGSNIYRVSDGRRPQKVSVTATSGKLSGQITAVSFSPEGSRVAVVLTDKDDNAQLWIGAVVRNGKQVRVDGLQAISPAGVTVVDAAWNDELKLFVVGSEPGGGGLYEVQCDGSLWHGQGLKGLPNTPDSITVVEDHPAAVSAGGTVWKQHGDTWVGLDDSATTSGTQPIYAAAEQ